MSTQRYSICKNYKEGVDMIGIKNKLKLNIFQFL